MRTLVYGGAASGKSEYAEALACAGAAPLYYIATMMPFNDEDEQRIERHRLMRAEKGFHTLERYTNLKDLKIHEPGCILLECLGNLAANELFSEQGAGKNAKNAILDGVFALEEQCHDLVVVTNNVFGDGGNYEDGTLEYILTLAEVNNVLAQRFERVIEVVCGIPIVMKEPAK
ncbi:MAG TPA: bifunctional adenosylcobinamide kinase/adenosylcobinamide-phosphate guanylyltransferase [Papillibacter sp.]|jgi:adenosylcobinamide kinase/adenosylcobinamide-phosphate guanylyltransferase|nr:bifunctional adenosylcobinamide kinase/adenosylcobinamide-phosphate guanylyltransferase [Papillibacter sp.]